MSIKNLTEHGQFTKEQLIEEARQAVIGCKNILRVSPNSEAHHISLRLAEITLEALTAPPAPVVPDEMLSIAERLVERYIANKGTESEFIACLTPGRSSVGTSGVWDDWKALDSALNACRAAMHSSTISNSADFAIDEVRQINAPAGPLAGADECDLEVFEKGKSACLVAISKDDAETICRGISAATGCKVDWHYVGGRVHIKALYGVPPAPVVPEIIPRALFDVIYQECDGFVDSGASPQVIWNACRAAMLKGGAI